LPPSKNSTKSDVDSLFEKPKTSAASIASGTNNKKQATLQVPLSADYEKNITKPNNCNLSGSQIISRPLQIKNRRKSVASNSSVNADQRMNNSSMIVKQVLDGEDMPFAVAAVNQSNRNSQVNNSTSNKSNSQHKKNMINPVK